MCFCWFENIIQAMFYQGKKGNKEVLLLFFFKALEK